MTPALARCPVQHAPAATAQARCTSSRPQTVLGYAVEDWRRATHVVRIVDAGPGAVSIRTLCGHTPTVFTFCGPDLDRKKACFVASAATHATARSASADIVAQPCARCVERAGRGR